MCLNLGIGYLASATGATDFGNSESLSGDTWLLWQSLMAVQIKGCSTSFFPFVKSRYLVNQSAISVLIAKSLTTSLLLTPSSLLYPSLQPLSILPLLSALLLRSSKQHQCCAPNIVQPGTKYLQNLVLLMETDFHHIILFDNALWLLSLAIFRCCTSWLHI